MIPGHFSLRKKKGGDERAGWLVPRFLACRDHAWDALFFSVACDPFFLFFSVPPLNAMCLAQAGAQLAAVSCPPWLRGGEGDGKGGEDATRKQRDIIPLSKQARTHRRIALVKASQKKQKADAMC